METAKEVLAKYLSRVIRRKAKQTVREKVESGTCLQCDMPAAHGCRGLCDYHHGQFKYAKRLVAQEVTITREEERRGITLPMKIRAAKKEFDNDRVEKGLALVSQQGKHGKQNPFRVTA